MPKTKIFLVGVILLLAALFFGSMPVCEANSAEPPSILIIVPRAPADLEISLGTMIAYRKDKANESYFLFDMHALQYASYIIKVSTASSSYEVNTGVIKGYDNLFTLNLGNRTLTPGKSLSRTFQLVSLRVMITLVVEGIVFFLFGFRKKKSWLYFLAINLVTQGILYLSLSNTSPLNNYIVFSLIGGELLVFIVETIAFLSLVGEHGKLRTFLYVIAANSASLALGLWLFSVLPI